MWIFIESLDSLFFRDSKPFAAGESFRAKSAFPPTPYPFAGALRTKILVDHGVDFETFKDWQNTPPNDPMQIQIRKWIGTPQDYGQLQIRGPLLASQKSDGSLAVYFQVPLNLFAKNWLSPLKESMPESSCNPPEGCMNIADLHLLWSRREIGKELTGHFLDEKGLSGYLRQKFELIKREDDEPSITYGAEELYTTEPRIGIKRPGSTRTAETGMFYLAEFIKFIEYTGRRLGFILELKDFPQHLLQHGIMALGGEKRAAECRHIEGALQEILCPGGSTYRKLVEQVRSTGRLKLYLASPAIFVQGWLPDCFDRNTMKLKDDHPLIKDEGISLTLIGACVGKPVSIGGWDLAQRGPRKMWRAVPTGSVYFLEITNPTSVGGGHINKIFETFHFTTNLQKYAAKGHFSHLSQIGFGLTFIGAWDYADS